MVSPFGGDSVLRVDPMLVYRHIPNKEALLDLTVERMRSAMVLAEDWRPSLPNTDVCSRPTPTCWRWKPAGQTL